MALIPPLTRTGGYFLALITFALLIVFLHAILIKPYMERALRAWYSRQAVEWVKLDGKADARAAATTTENLVGRRLNDSVRNFIAARYVRMDRETGNLKPRDDCDGYLHFFPFTDLGCGLSVVFDPRKEWRVREVQPVPYAKFRGRQLKEFVQECLTRSDDWPRLYREQHQVDRATVPLSALKRYSYRVGFEPRDYYTRGVGLTAAGDAGDDTSDMPSTSMEALIQSRGENAVAADLVLTFVYADKLTGKTWRFQLTDYKPSLFFGVRSSENHTNETGVIWERLPPLHLDRSSSSTVAAQADTIVLFQQDSESLAADLLLRGQQQAEQTGYNVNPCWNSTINRFRLGNFPVDAASFSMIYLRGLQVVTDREAENNPEIQAILRRMFWSCVDSSGTSSRSNIVSRSGYRGSGNGGGGEDGGSGGGGKGGSGERSPVLQDKTDQYHLRDINVQAASSIITDTVLSLQLCLENTEFSPKTQRCQAVQ